MYKQNLLGFPHTLAGSPPKMPIDIVLMLPDYVTDPGQSESLFNLPGAINDFMGRTGWDKAIQVMNPMIVAPQWTDQELHNFASIPFDQDHVPFPALDPQGLRPRAQDFEIVHIIADFASEAGETVINLGESLRPWPDRQALLDSLNDSGARMLILQNPSFLNRQPAASYQKQASELAQWLIEQGGPPVLIIADATDPHLLNKYLRGFYLNILHNQMLSQAAQPEPDTQAAIWAELFLGIGGEEILLISRVQEDLSLRAGLVNPIVESMINSYQASVAVDQMKAYLRSDQTDAFEKRAREMDDAFAKLGDQALHASRSVNLNLNYQHEWGAALPLGEGSASVRMAEAVTNRYPEVVTDLKAEIMTAASRAPRVLNASFADPQSRKVLEPKNPLVAGQEYDLLVDIGPRWTTIKSLVTGNDAFPELALPMEQDGYLIHVVFISNDLEPGIYSGWIWVPRNTGRSFSYDLASQKKANESGPIAMSIKAPGLKSGEDRTQLHGRLCLYYLNNLLQSARVQATVTRTPDAVLEHDNVVDVDYVLSGTVQDLDRFATRKVSVGSSGLPQEQPVTLNLTLNDDGKAHRIVVRELDEQPNATPANNSPVGWTPFDAAAARTALDQAREDLKSCFYERDAYGKPVLDNAGEPKVSLDQNRKGKTRDQFKWDLLTLAKLGNGLFNTAFGDVRPEGKWATNAQWMRALQKRLEKSSIIQVSRTGPANYVFPWGLLYQYPLPGPSERFKFCRIVKEEWADDGTRQKSPEPACPYRNEGWHVENVICPYGFWGLNHIIEQPGSALRQLADGSYIQKEATDTISMRDANLDLSIVVTHDVSPADLTAHLTRLEEIKPLRINPAQPADDTDKVRDMLKGATLVYFLCHGEYDSVRTQPYLSIGLRDGQEIHRIYPETLQGWARTPDLAAWETEPPLIFINGCHTADLKPGEVLNFVTAFGLAGAGGIIGTEVSVLASVAMDISEQVFEKMIAEKLTVGQAMYQTRWDLVNRGNLLGLAYTLYCLANLHVATN
jgi:CHAT domain